MLHELPTPVGTLLWKTLRSTRLWMSERGVPDLFTPGSYEDRVAEVMSSGASARVAELAQQLAAVMDPEQRPEPQIAALGCAQLSEWAAREGLAGTRLAFAEAAAQLCPGDATHAHLVARALRDTGDYVRADLWYRHTILLARRGAQWDVYTLAYIGLGRNEQLRGAYARARRAYRRAVRRGVRMGLSLPRAMALHDLFTLEAEVRDYPLALEYARAAFEAYGPGHARLPALAVDLAYFWMEHGRAASAYPVIRAVLPLLPITHHVGVHGNLAHAAAAAGDAGGYDHAARVVWRADRDAPGRADALLEVARAARRLGRPEDARAAAGAALETARARREGRLVLTADALLTELAAAPSVEIPTKLAPVESLANEIVRGLAACST